MISLTLTLALSFPFAPNFALNERFALGPPCGPPPSLSCPSPSPSPPFPLHHPRPRATAGTPGMKRGGRTSSERPFGPISMPRAPPAMDGRRRGELRRMRQTPSFPEQPGAIRTRTCPWRCGTPEPRSASAEGGSADGACPRPDPKRAGQWRASGASEANRNGNTARGRRSQSMRAKDPPRAGSRRYRSGHRISRSSNRRTGRNTAMAAAAAASGGIHRLTPSGMSRKRGMGAGT